ncbi:MAG: prephenate dehydratase domain-containing protein [Candidatus Latescibacterota bacterium]|nr:prephenate dehydratase domain-containing protein [Candidatus Latescibacterota bacterium]
MQGELGSNSAQAATMHFGEDVDLCTCTNFTQLFQAISQGRADYAMAPVENSLAGSESVSVTDVAASSIG